MENRSVPVVWVIRASELTYVITTPRQANLTAVVVELRILFNMKIATKTNNVFGKENITIMQKKTTPIK